MFKSAVGAPPLHEPLGHLPFQTESLRSENGLLQGRGATMPSSVSESLTSRTSDRFPCIRNRFGMGVQYRKNVERICA